jgi:hypothetical protein
MINPLQQADLCLILCSQRCLAVAVGDPSLLNKPLLNTSLLKTVQAAHYQQPPRRYFHWDNVTYRMGTLLANTYLAPRISVEQLGHVALHLLPLQGSGEPLRVNTNGEGAHPGDSAVGILNTLWGTLQNNTAAGGAQMLW